MAVRPFRCCQIVALVGALISSLFSRASCRTPRNGYSPYHKAWGIKKHADPSFFSRRNHALETCLSQLRCGGGPGRPGGYDDGRGGNYDDRYYGEDPYNNSPGQYGQNQNSGRYDDDYYGGKGGYDDYEDRGRDRSVSPQARSAISRLAFMVHSPFAIQF